MTLSNIEAVSDLLPCPFCGSTDIATDGPSYTLFMCNDCGGQTYDQDSHAEAIAAWNRRSANSAGGVEVKPLEWHGPDVNGDRHATSIFGTYTIRKQQGSMGFWLTQVGGYHRTVADAEASAQSDHNRRILSVLTHPSSPVSAEVTVTDIERAARAMCERDGFDWEPESCLQTANGDEPEEQRDYWRDKAEAALAALNGGRDNG